MAEKNNSSAADAINGMILADGYQGGIAISDPTGHHEISLYYKTSEQAEAAFDVITTLIDAAIREQTKEGEDRA